MIWFFIALVVSALLGATIAAVVGHEWLSHQRKMLKAYYEDEMKHIKDRETTAAEFNDEIYIGYYRNSSGQWRYQIRSTGNHENLSPQDPYSTKQKLFQTAKKFKCLIKEIKPPK